MNDGVFRPLLAADFSLMLDRFSEFSDGVIRDLHLAWGGACRPNSSTVEIAVEAMETTDENGWKNVTFRALDVRDFYWEECWQGTIETLKMVLRHFDGWSYLAVGIEWEEFETASSFTVNTTRMFVRARHLYYLIE